MWESVKERLPKKGTNCAVYVNGGSKHKYFRWAVYTGGSSWYGDGGGQMSHVYPDGLNNITHWLPLTAPSDSHINKSYNPVELAKLVPSNWTDPLLAGKNKALTGEAGKWGCPDIENLLNAIRERIKAANHLPSDKNNNRMVQCSNHEPGKSCDIYSCSWKCGNSPCEITAQNHA